MNGLIATVEEAMERLKQEIPRDGKRETTLFLL
jgi:hypothetical protein